VLCPRKISRQLLAPLIVGVGVGGRGWLTQVQHEAHGQRAVDGRLCDGFLLSELLC